MILILSTFLFFEEFSLSSQANFLWSFPYYVLEFSIKFFLLMRVLYNFMTEFNIYYIILFYKVLQYSANFPLMSKNFLLHGFVIWKHYIYIYHTLFLIDFNFRQFIRSNELDISVIFSMIFFYCYGHFPYNFLLMFWYFP